MCDNSDLCFIFSISVYVKEELDHDVFAADIVNPSDIRADGTPENVNVKKDSLDELVVKMETVNNYSVSKDKIYATFFFSLNIIMFSFFCVFLIHAFNECYTFF